MASIAPPRRTVPNVRDRRVVRAAPVAMALLLLLAAVFLFAGPPMPILLWDESRNIVNAMEMRSGGLSLVTRYGGVPDLWNTKPPLLIWLMVASTDLFGAHLWALRLPNMAATMATLLVVMVLVRRVSGSTATAGLAAALLVASPALYGEHGARTADYDPLLLFFTTSYGALLFLALHGRRRGAILPAALAVAGAVLTKGVAGVLPGIGIALYWGASGRLPDLWRITRYRVSAGLAMALVAAFFVAREIAAPGYLAASWQNDLARRFHQSVIGAEQPASHYVGILAAGYFSATPLVLLAPVAFFLARGRSRWLILYAGVVAAALIAVLSLAASKLNHYILPALPFLAILAALTARTLGQRAATLWRTGQRLVPIAIAGTVCLLLGVAADRAVVYRYASPVQSDFAARQAPYGALIDRLAGLDRPITVVEPGFTLERWPHYAAVLDGYRWLAAANGVVVARRLDVTDLPPGTIVASCDPATVRRLASRGPDVAGVPGCIATR